MLCIAFDITCQFFFRSFPTFLSFCKFFLTYTNIQFTFCNIDINDIIIFYQRNHTACGSLGGSVSLLLVFVIGLCWFTWYGHSIFAKQWIVKCDLRKTIYYFCYKFLL